MAATPRLALPYPVASDTADVPRDILALATKLDDYPGIAPPLVSALPVAPYEGQEIYFQTANMASTGTMWKLRYRGAISDSSKWEYVGGPPIEGQTNNTTVFANGAGWKRFPGPIQVPIPLKGNYLVRGQAQLQVGGAAGGISLGIGTDTNPTPSPSSMYVTAQSGGGGTSMVAAVSGVRGFDPLTENYAELTVNLNALTGITPWWRTIELQPIRLG
jgi:hypothetical protein